MDEDPTDFLVDTRSPRRLRPKATKRRAPLSTRRTPSGVSVQGSLADSPDDLQAALAKELAEAELDRPRLYCDLTPEQQEGWIPHLIQDWFHTDVDPGAFDAVFLPLMGDLEGHVRTGLMNGPYVPSITWRGRANWLRAHLDLPWSEDLDHAVRFQARTEFGKLVVRVSAPRRLGLELDSVRENLAVLVGEHWLMADEVADRLLQSYLDAAYWQRHLGDWASFDGRGNWLG